MRFTRLQVASLRAFAAAATLAVLTVSAPADDLELAPLPDGDTLQLVEEVESEVIPVSQITPAPGGNAAVPQGLGGEEVPARDPNGDNRVQCPSVEEMRGGLKPISSLGVNIIPENPMLALPPDCAAEMLSTGPGREPLLADLPRGWAQLGFAWEAPGLKHFPLYFEDAPLERYGQTISPLLQPAISGAKFFGTIPLLPYKMALNPPLEHVYALGYYRPGSCAPFVRQRLPIQLDALAIEGAAITAFIFFIP